MEAIAIIPARMAATRFPNKPLANIAGKSMIAHCYLRAMRAKKIKAVYVATPDAIIATEIKRLGGNVLMTSYIHQRASDRTAEAMQQLIMQGEKIDVVVMLQGDEPLINPNDLDRLVMQHEQFPETPVFNLTQSINTQSDFQNPNVVKLITALNNTVLTFSRAPIPYLTAEKFISHQPQKQLGVISFTRTALEQFSSLTPTPLEITESIDLMRFLEHGFSIKVVQTNTIMQGVDTPEDAKKVTLLMAQEVTT